MNKRSPFKQFINDLKSDPAYQAAIVKGQITGDYYAVSVSTIKQYDKEIRLNSKIKTL